MDPDIKVVSMKEWAGRNENLVELMEFILEKAKEGTLVGAAGVFLIEGDEDDPGPKLGLMKTENMYENVFTVTGALERVKLQLMLEMETG